MSVIQEVVSMQKGVVIQGLGVAAIQEIAIPKATGQFLKIRTCAVALNPSDWKHVYWRADKGALVGLDYAGYVEEIGPLVRRPFKVGDRIAGFTHGCKLLAYLAQCCSDKRTCTSKHYESSDRRLRRTCHW